MSNYAANNEAKLLKAITIHLDKTMYVIDIKQWTVDNYSVHLYIQER